jgi:putative ABC transport system permease protein
MLPALLRDARYALRTLAKAPAVTGVALLALALGIGANTAIFTLVKAVLLSPLPYPEPDRLALVMRSYKDNTVPTLSVLKLDYWRTRSKSFSAVAGFDVIGSGYNLVAPGGEPERLQGIRVMGDFFSAVGVHPMLGRGFSPAEDRAGGPHVVVLSYGLWQRRFGGDPNIVGRHLSLSGLDREVVGVMPLSFRPAPEAEIWLPLQMPVAADDISNYLLCLARLKPGVSVEQSRTELKGLFASFAREYPKAVFDFESVTAVPAGDTLASAVKPALMVLLGAVALVLLIACANVANLLLARATGRTREIAIRISMGASRWHLARQLLVESVLLSLGGALLGFLLGQAGVRLLVSLMPVKLPIFDFTPDLRVLGFTVAVALATGLLFGLAPAIQAWHTDVNGALKESGRAGETRKRGLVRRSLVGVEMALAVVLVVGAALLMETLFHLRGLDPGFDPSNVVTMQMSVTGPRYEDPVQLDNFYRRAVQRIETLPGVESAATVTSLPLERGPDMGYAVEGQSDEGGAQWRAVSTGYFRTLRLRLLRGRVFADSDTSQSTPVVIINESFARRHWPGREAVGERLTIGKNQNVGDPPRLIVGVVSDVKESGLDTAPPLVTYVPTSQVPRTVGKMINALIPAHWVIRARVDPMTVVNAIRNELKQVDPEQPVSNIRTMDEVLSQSLVLRSLSAGLLGVFAGLALLLAAIGVYGVMSYSVAQRTHEIGIRMALGASRNTVIGMVLRQAGVVALFGVGFGLLAAGALTKVMTSLVYGVSATNPFTFIGVALALTAVALISSYLPARRAMKVDPVIALRTG